MSLVQPATSNLFEEAVRENVKGRITIYGPSGSGKTKQALLWAQYLAERDGTFVVVADTENKTSVKYVGDSLNGSEPFKFQVSRIDAPYHPNKIINWLKALATEFAENPPVVIIDSGSHFWEGSGGVLAIVDDVTKKSSSKNSFQAWGEGTPLHQAFLQSIVEYPGHIIFCMRAKTAYAQDKVDGRTKITKLGLEPVQRNGVEYEFDLALNLDQKTHSVEVSKTRFSDLDGLTIAPDRILTDLIVPFSDWLSSGVERDVISAVELKELRASVAALTPEGKRGFNEAYRKGGFPKSDGLSHAQLDEVREILKGYVATDATPEGESGDTVEAPE